MRVGGCIGNESKAPAAIRSESWVSQPKWNQQRHQRRFVLDVFHENRKLHDEPGENRLADIQHDGCGAGSLESIDFICGLWLTSIWSLIKIQLKGTQSKLEIHSICWILISCSWTVVTCVSFAWAHFEMVLIEFTLLAIAISLLYVYLTWNFNYWRKRGVVGPRPLPFLGSYSKYSLLKQNLMYNMDELYQ